MSIKNESAESAEWAKNQGWSSLGWSEAPAQQSTSPQDDENGTESPVETPAAQPFIPATEAGAGTRSNAKPDAGFLGNNADAGQPVAPTFGFMKPGDVTW